MKTEFKNSFLKELKKLKNIDLKNSILNHILEIESAKNIAQIKNIKKLSGFNKYYRIRIGDYRIGIKVEADVVYFAVIEHRKDIYKRFP